LHRELSSDKKTKKSIKNVSKLAEEKTDSKKAFNFPVLIPIVGEGGCTVKVPVAPFFREPMFQSLPYNKKKENALLSESSGHIDRNVCV